jgi:hypothetical protein
MAFGFVEISERVFRVNMKPQFGKFGLVVCNFSEREDKHRIYVPDGPHVHLRTPAKMLFEQVKMGQRVALDPIEGVGLGHIEMLTGYPAVDLGHGIRNILSLSVALTRSTATTSFSFQGIASEPMDPTTHSGSELETGIVCFSLGFDVADDQIDDLLPTQGDREVFIECIQHSL